MVCRSEICATIALISSIAATAAVVSPWIASTRRAMSSVAFAVSCASSLTSFATTAKPLPASPARAASIVAFSASRFVCSAMQVITFTTLPISAERVTQLGHRRRRRLRRRHRAGRHLGWPPPRSTAISRIEAPICSAPAATVCTLRETSSAAPSHDTGLRRGLLAPTPRSAPRTPTAPPSDAATASAEATTAGEHLAQARLRRVQRGAPSGRPRRAASTPVRDGQVAAGQRARATRCTPPDAADDRRGRPRSASEQAEQDGDDDQRRSRPA